MSTFPATPTDVPDAPYRDIIESHLRHVQCLIDAQHGTGPVLPAGELAAHAVAALAAQHAVAERILYTRWCTARDALVYGATASDVAAAMGLDVDEVVMGLRSWADRQYRQHLMARDLCDEVHALVDGAEQQAGER